MIFAVLLPVIAFFLVWIFIADRMSSEDSDGFRWQESLIQAALFWSVFVVLSTEGLSLIRALTPLGISLLWVFALVVLGILHWQFASFSKGWLFIKHNVFSRPENVFGHIALGVSILTLAVLLITGYLSPPNVHDEMTYHMSRIMHWRQNQSVMFFPTSITWQLWMPPFNEFVQLHWQLLSGGDYFAWLPQWYHLVLTMVTVGAIAGRMGARKTGQWIASLFVLTLPIIVLQASGAKNDIAVAFFFSVLAYYVVKASQQRLKLIDQVSTGMAVGLGILTKGNFPFFALPLLVWLLVVMLRRAGWKPSLTFAGVGLALVLLINSGHWFRNTATFGGPFNTGYADFTLNARFGPDVVFSNMSKNIAVQLRSFGFVNRGVEEALARMHAGLNIPLFDPDTTQGPREFYSMPTREEVAGNPLHFGLSGLAFLALLIFTLIKKDRDTVWSPLYLGLAALAGMMVFSGVFRWQVWGSRYFIPYYVVFAPLVGYVFGRRFPAWSSWMLGLSLIFIMTNPLLNNFPRSFSWSVESRNSIWRRSRKALRFANHHVYEGGILSITHVMDVSGCRTYGMAVGMNAPEYLLWSTLTPGPEDYVLKHIEVDNHSVIHQTEDFDPCGIIVFEARQHPEKALQAPYEFFDHWQFDPDWGHPLALYLQPAFFPEISE